MIEAGVPGYEYGQMSGVFAELERALIQERVRAGMARAKAQGVRLGRPRVSKDLERQIIELRKAGNDVLKIARSLGCGASTVQRVDAERRAA